MKSLPHRWWSVCVCLLLTLGSVALGQSSSAPSLISGPVDEANLVKLNGNVHPAVRIAADLGIVEPSYPMDRMMLVLRHSPQQQQALDAFMAQQYDRTSANFHHWLQPEEFGTLYGPSDADLSALTAWLQNHGFRVDTIAKGRMFIEFSGNAGQVQQAFHTEIHRYRFNGELHTANATDPSIPAAFGPAVVGIRSLHNFGVKTSPPTPSLAPAGAENTLSTPSNAIARPDVKAPNGDPYAQGDLIGPPDFATEYNVNPVFLNGINGAGVTIAIPGMAAISPADVTAFWTRYGIPSSNRLTITVNGAPVTPANGAAFQGIMDVEWAGALAPGAHINFVTTQPTSTGGGVLDSAAYIIDHDLAPIMTMTFEGCELQNGAAANASWYALTQQAAAEGISIFAESGQTGSADCDQFGDLAQYGLQVNGLASSPFVTAVGATDVAQTPTWNSAGDLTQYVPETTWNGSCAGPRTEQFYGWSTNPEQACQSHYQSGLIQGSGGGVSACTTPSTAATPVCSGGYAKPQYQTGTGVPADGKRDLPDLSLFAAPGATGPGAVIECTLEPSVGDCTNTGSNPVVIEVGGTPLAADAMAGIMALVVQSMGAPQGNANYVLYQLAALDNRAACNSNTVTPGNACNFYDITEGNNQQPCALSSPYAGCVAGTSTTVGVLSGYQAGAGYDLATGLGSVNVANLVQNWPSVVAADGPQFTLPSSINFPNTPVGTVATQSFQITNSGTWTLYLQPLAITGVNHTDFSVAKNCKTSLAPGASCTVSLTFKPPAGGVFNANVTFNAGWSPRSIPITGTGIGLVFSAPSISLRPTPVGSVSPAGVITVTNPNPALSLTGITLAGVSPSLFTQLNNCGASLAASSSCTLMAAFAPQSLGSSTALIDFFSGGNSIPQSVKLSGAGLPQPTLTLNTTALNFLPANAGANQAVPVLLTNTGARPIVFSQFSITGPGALSFQQVNTCPASLNPGDSCTFFVAFVPSASGSAAANLTITDNAAGSPQMVALTGTSN